MHRRSSPTVEGDAMMLTMEDYAKQSREERTQCLTRTADALAAAIQGQSEAVLARRPDARNWSAVEIVCHLRDSEEIFAERMEQIVAMDVDPRLIVTDPDRWAEDRQYLANNAERALGAFRRRRAETLKTFGDLTVAQWGKGGIHPVLGRITLDGFLAVMAWHDDNHLAQFTRALQGGRDPREDRRHFLARGTSTAARRSMIVMATLVSW